MTAVTNGNDAGTPAGNALLDGLLPPSFQRAQFLALLVGAGGLILSAVAYFVDPDQFFVSYLFGFLFWLGITLGSLAWVCIHHLTGGNWGRAIQRVAEAAALNTPLMALFFLPILLGLPSLFPWANPEQVAHDDVLIHKSAWLNPSFFTLRYVIYFVLWSGLAWMLAHSSRAYDRDQGAATARRIRRLCALGVVLYILTITFAGIDWIMSRESHWFSTIFGFIVAVGQAFSAILFLVVVLTLLIDREPLVHFVTEGIYNDLGNLMLTCTILWSYLSFAQLLVSWTGNLQEETRWYSQRSFTTPYKVMDFILITFHFFVPFFLLLMRPLKRRPRTLARIALGLLVVRLIDVFWMVIPSGSPRLGTPSNAPGINWAWMWAHLAVVAGIGGVWLALFIWQLGRRPLLSLPEYENPELAAEEEERGDGGGRLKPAH